MKMPSIAPLPVAVAVHLAGAVDALKLADDALGVALNALAGIEMEMQPAGVGTYDIIGIQASVRLFVGLFGPVADAVRLPPCAMGTRHHVREIIEDERNVPGLQRAAFALDIAAANFEEAVEAFNKSAGGDEFYNPCLAAQHVCEKLAVMIASAIFTGRRGPGPAFGVN